MLGERSVSRGLGPEPENVSSNVLVGPKLIVAAGKGASVGWAENINIDNRIGTVVLFSRLRNRLRT